MKNATLADIVISAQTAAQKALVADTELAQENIKLAEFAASGFDAADFPTWQNSFGAQLTNLEHLSKQDSPATVAAKAAATKTPSPAKKAPAQA